MKISPEVQLMSQRLNELLLAHTQFDKALDSADYEGMHEAQRSIERARVRAGIALRKFERSQLELVQLDGLLDEGDLPEMERNTRV